MWLDSHTTHYYSQTVLMMATQALVDELKGTKVYVNSMCPGMIPGTNLSYANASQSTMWVDVVQRIFGIVWKH